MFAFANEWKVRLGYVFCALFHHSAKTWKSRHHSWEFSCNKCGRSGVVQD